MDRLIRKDRALHKSNLRRFRRKPKSKQKKNQKMDSPPTTLTERLVKRVLKYSDAKLPDSIEASLNLILKELFVLPSLKSGLLGDPQKLNIAGDGTCMPTHAAHYGKKICDCVLKPGEFCKCKRKFTDPSATWGWDSYHERYFYGHTFHVITAADSFYSLPIHIKCVTGERHDSVTGIFALKEVIDLYPEIKCFSAAFDSAYDNTSFYLLNQFYNIHPVIALNGRNSKPASKDALVKFDDNGIPHGKKCDHKLRNWGLIKKSYRRKWLFPVQCDSCQKCEASSNKTFYTPTSDNLRYFGPILRNTKQWKKLYKRRTTTERFNDRMKLDFKVKDSIIYTRERRIVRTFMAAFCCYIDAWSNDKSLKITDIFPGIRKLAG
ncbi:MAG: transposase [Firmicutes bacterium]|nr:transposase [Bacillota bacterium]